MNLLKRAKIPQPRWKFHRNAVALWEKSSSHFVTCFQLAVLSPRKYDDGSTLYVCSRSISQQWLVVDKKEFGAAIRRNFPLCRNFANDYALDGNLLRESFVLPACTFQVCRLLNRSWCIVDNTFRNTHVFVRINIRKRTIHIIYRVVGGCCYPEIFINELLNIVSRKQTLGKIVLSAFTRRRILLPNNIALKWE